MPATQNIAEVTLDRVIVATDFTPESDKAVAYGRAFAHECGSRLTLAHVVDLSVTSAHPEAVVGFDLNQMRNDSSENLNRIVRDLKDDGITAQGSITEAPNPADAIIQLSGQMNADLVIVGTHSRQGLSKLILGSCSEEVIHGARCPVLTIGPMANSDPTNIRFQSIVFATDLKNESIVEAADALTFAKSSIADFHICRVMESRHGENVINACHGRAGLESVFSALSPKATFSWYNLGRTFLSEGVDQEVLRVADEADADLIVVGVRPGLHNWWVGVVDKIIRAARCPVLTVCTC